MQKDRSPIVVYRNMDKAALDVAYNNSAAVTNSQRWLDEWSVRSASIRTADEVQPDLAYGPGPRNRIDYFPVARKRAPLFAFIHGGYWQRNSKEIFAFVAQGPRAHGISVATIGYTLAPQARLSEIVAEIMQALDFLAANSEALNFDRDEIFIGGWSAGAHLATLALRHPRVRGGLAISGIFDLRPIALSYINDALKLGIDEISQLSPILNLGPSIAPLRLCVGGHELPELQRQSAAYAQAANVRGVPVSFTVLPDDDHFSILENLASGDGRLTHELLRLRDPHLFLSEGAPVTRLGSLA